jgi:hypothetical protein
MTSLYILSSIKGDLLVLFQQYLKIDKSRLLNPIRSFSGSKNLPLKLAQTYFYQ